MLGNRVSIWHPLSCFDLLNTNEIQLGRIKNPKGNLDNREMGRKKCPQNGLLSSAIEGDNVSGMNLQHVQLCIFSF